MACQQEMAQLNKELITQFADSLKQEDGYIHRKADLSEASSEQEKLEKLLATYGVSNLLVESNLTALIMTGIIYLNKLPSVSQRLLDEIATEPEINLETMRKMPYLDCIYKECLRFASPTPYLVRETSKTCSLEIEDDKGQSKLYDIPAKSLLFTPIRRIHHDPKYWNNPEAFIPERFEDPASLEHFLPFSIGIRSCPAAAHFNEIAFKTAILASLRYQWNYDKNLETISVHSITSRWSEEYYATPSPR